MAVSRAALGLQAWICSSVVLSFFGRLGAILVPKKSHFGQAKTVKIRSKNGLVNKRLVTDGNQRKPRLLEMSWGGLWVVLGRLGATLERLGVVLGRLGAILGWSCGALGALLCLF